jgi:hypothetical protein
MLTKCRAGMVIHNSIFLYKYLGRLRTHRHIVLNVKGAKQLLEISSPCIQLLLFLEKRHGSPPDIFIW